MRPLVCVALAHVSRLGEHVEVAAGGVPVRTQPGRLEGREGPPRARHPTRRGGLQALPEGRELDAFKTVMPAGYQEFKTVLPAEFAARDGRPVPPVRQETSVEFHVRQVQEWFQARLAQLQQMIQAPPDPDIFLTRLPNDIRWRDPAKDDIWHTKVPGDFKGLHITVEVDLPDRGRHSIVAETDPWLSVESFRQQLWSFLTGQDHGTAVYPVKFTAHSLAGRVQFQGSPALEVHRTRQSIATGKEWTAEADGRTHRGWDAFRFAGSQDTPTASGLKLGSDWTPLSGPWTAQAGGLNLKNVWDWRFTLKTRKSKNAAPGFLGGCNGLLGDCT